MSFILNNKYFNILFLLSITAISDVFYRYINISITVKNIYKYLFFIYIVTLFIYYFIVKKRENVFSKFSLVVIFFLYLGITILWSEFKIQGIISYINFLCFAIYSILIVEKTEKEYIIDILYKYSIIITLINLIVILFIPSVANIYVNDKIAAIKGVFSSRSGLVVNILFCIVIIISKFNKTKRNIFINSTLVLINIVIILCTKSSTGILALVLFPVFYLIFDKKNKYSFILGTVVMILVIIIPFLNLGNEIINNAFGLIFHKSSTFSSRSYIWEYSISLIRKGLFFGVGIESIQKYINPNIILTSVNRSFSHTHNGALEVILEFGIIGFILLIMIYIEVLKVLRTKRERNVKFLGVILLLICVFSTMEPFFVNRNTLPILWLPIVMLYSLKESNFNCYLNNEKLPILYITFVDFNNLNSGSSVRPKKMYDSFMNLGYDVKLLTGLQNRYIERWKNVYKFYKSIRYNKYDFCYVEPPAGPIFNLCDHILLVYIKYIKKVPIGVFYRDAYWKFASWYEVKGLKRIIINLMHVFDLYIFNNVCKVIYFPSISMKDLFNLKPKTYALPPGAEKNIYIEKNNFDAKTIIYVGAVGGNNGTDMMLEALDIVYQYNKDVKLILIVRNVNEDIKKHINKPWLEVITNVSGIEQLKKYYYMTTYAIIPRKKDIYMDFAVPIKLYEYISFGVPIISTNCREIKHIIEDNQLGLITDDDVNILASVILEAFKDEEKYNCFKTNLKKYIMNNTWENRIKEIESTLNRRN